MNADGPAVAVSAAPQAVASEALLALLPALAVGVLAFVAMFHQEAAAAVSVWVESTAFGHCFLVLPIALFLAWERRGRLLVLLRADIRPRPQIWAIPAIVLPALGWFAAERLGIMEGRQLAAMAMFQLMVFAVLGPELWRSMAAPLLYLVFLVPFGAFITPALQHFTARFIDMGLAVLDIPHLVSDTLIEIPAGTFRVAEACAGLRFLIASIAFGVLYACTMYRSPLRRIAFVVCSIVVPIIANGFRALGIVVLGEILGSAEAAAVDHIVYGWLFFTIVTVLLILGGLPFREDRSDPHPIPARANPIRTRRSTSTAVTVVAAIVVLAAVGPVTSAWLDREASAEQAERQAMPPLNLPAGCAMVPGATIESGLQHVACGKVDISVRATAFSPRSTPQLMLATQSAYSGPGEVVASSRVTDRGGHSWRLVETTEPARIYAIGFWATPDGSPSSGLAWRIRQAAASTFGERDSGWRPTLVIASVEGPATEPDLSDILRRFVAAQPDLAAEISARHSAP